MSKEASTGINENGNFKIGILEGTITGDYQAKYIGAMSKRTLSQRTRESITGNL
ncbi:MAG: hypothetical protein ACLUTO_00120 [Anaerostipes sp.]